MNVAAFVPTLDTGKLSKISVSTTRAHSLCQLDTIDTSNYGTRKPVMLYIDLLHARFRSASNSIRIITSNICSSLEHPIKKSFA